MPFTPPHDFAQEEDRVINREDFWSEVFRVHGSVTPYIMGRVLFFCLFAVGVCVVAHYTHWEASFAVAPYEIVGVVLALLLVLRTNAGYDRWYEGRKLWGGIVKQCRNLAMIGSVYGPRNAEWQSQFARWTIAFAHASRHSLRGETNLADMQELLGTKEATRLSNAQHLPMYVAGRLGWMLRQDCDAGVMDRFAFMQAENQRTTLIDHIGACERIMRTPLARVFSIKIRRFLFLYLTGLPIAIVDKTGMMTPVIVLLVAYSLLSLDQIGIELQSPFSKDRLSHLPLDDISANIERNILEFDQEDMSSLFAETYGQLTSEPEFERNCA